MGSTKFTGTRFDAVTSLNLSAWQHIGGQRSPLKQTHESGPERGNVATGLLVQVLATGEAAISVESL